MRKFFLPFYITFIKKMVEEMSPHIDKGGRVLDFGCGSGLLGYLINKDLGVEVMGIDVKDHRKFAMPLTLYDGSRIPFPDNYFDAVLSVYVFHHTPNSEKLLSEIKRVCRGNIIIYEDTPANPTERIFCRLHGKVFNGFFNIHNDCHFLSKSAWLDLFEENRLKLKYIKDIKLFNPTYITKRTLFVLTKQSSY